MFDLGGINFERERELSRLEMFCFGGARWWRETSNQLRARESGSLLRRGSHSLYEHHNRNTCARLKVWPCQVWSGEGRQTGSTEAKRTSFELVFVERKSDLGNLPSNSFTIFWVICFTGVIWHRWLPSHLPLTLHASKIIVLEQNYMKTDSCIGTLPCLLL